MKNPFITLIGLDVSENQNENIDSIRKMDFLRESNIHFVHVVKEYVTGYDIMSNSQIVFEEDKEAIKQSVNNRLKEISKEILPVNFSGNVSYHCFFGFDPKQTLVNVAADLKANLMVLATRGDIPLLDESFSHYCGLHSPCDVLIVRKGIHDQFKGRLKVACAMKVDEDSLHKVSLKNFPFLEKARLNLIYISPSSRFSFIPGLVDNFSPEERQLVVREAVMNRLEKNKSHFLPEGFTGEFNIECLFSNHIKKAFYERVKEIDADLCVIPQKQKTFGSFLHFQLTHGLSNILVLRVN